MLLYYVNMLLRYVDMLFYYVDTYLISWCQNLFSFICAKSNPGCETWGVIFEICRKKRERSDNEIMIKVTLTLLLMERQINIYSNICTYPQIYGPRYKSFIPLFKSFVPSYKSFTPRYKWFEDRNKWFVPRFKWFIPIFKYDYLYLGTNHLYLSSNTVGMATFTISLWTEANWT